MAPIENAQGFFVHKDSLDDEHILFDIARAVKEGKISQFGESEAFWQVNPQKEKTRLSIKGMSVIPGLPDFYYPRGNPLLGLAPQSSYLLTENRVLRALGLRKVGYLLNPPGITMAVQGQEIFIFTGATELSKGSEIEFENSHGLLYFSNETKSGLAAFALLSRSHYPITTSIIIGEYLGGEKTPTFVPHYALLNKDALRILGIIFLNDFWSSEIFFPFAINEGFPDLYFPPPKLEKLQTLTSQQKPLVLCWTRKKRF